MRLIHRTKTLWLWLEQPQSSRVSWLIFAIAVIVRMLVSLVTRTYTDLGRYEMERAAISLAQTGAMANPYLIPTGYTAHVAPGYALVLAAVFRLFGTGYTAEIVKEFVSCCATGAIYALLPAVSPALGFSRRAGIAAGIFGASLPLKYAIETMGDWEGPFAALALLLSVWAVAVTWRKQEFTLMRGAREGLAWGVALLIAPALLPVLAAVMLLGSFAVKERRIRYLPYLAAVVAVVGLCLAPWAWRNERRLGAPVFTRTNFGLEMRLSNNDDASPLEPVNLRRRLYDRFHPLQNLREAEAVRAMGEVSYNRDRLERAIVWIRAHPRTFATLTALRIWYTWFPSTPVRWRDILIGAVTIASVLGLIALAKSEPIFALLLAVTMISYTAPYSLIHVSIKHRYPIDWIILLSAAHSILIAVTQLAARFGWSAHERTKAAALLGGLT